MCQSPVKILNPKLAWKPTDPKYLVVQCGRCFECRARKQQEWFVRSYYEYKSNINGSNFFFTLTFNNANLPVYTDKRDFQYKEINGVVVKVKKVVDYQFSCFDNKLTTLFLKRLRSNFKRRFPNHDTSGIKYFITCEYGEHTHRPHLHGNFYIPFKVSVHDFKDLICKSWQYGFVGSSRKGGFLIKTISALEYTAKYSTKDLYFFDRVMSDYLDKDSLSPSEYKYRCSRVSRFLPKLRNSNNFGSALIDEIRNDDHLFDKLLSNRPLQLPKKNGLLRDFLLPRYVVNKLCKRVDKYFSKLLGRPYYVLTDVGEAYKRLLLVNKLNTDVTDINWLSSAHHLNSLSGKSSYDKWWLSSVKKSLSDLISRLDPVKISVYKNVLRYLPVTEYGKHSADWYFSRTNMIANNLFSFSIPLELDSAIKLDTLHLRKYLDYDYKVSRPVREISDGIKVLSQLGEFQVYERFCQVLDDYNKWICSYRCKQRRLKQSRIDSVLAAFADFVLYDSDGLTRLVV